MEENETGDLKKSPVSCFLSTILTIFSDNYMIQ